MYMFLHIPMAGHTFTPQRLVGAPTSFHSFLFEDLTMGQARYDNNGCASLSSKIVQEQLFTSMPIPQCCQCWTIAGARPA